MAHPSPSPGTVEQVSADGWNFADIWERIASRIPTALAQKHLDHETTWAEFNARANGVAAHLLAAGLVEQDKVAQYLYNCPEYLESVFGAFKAGMAIVNTNYRYTTDEIIYLWDNADVVAVVFHGTFADRCAEVRPHLPKVTTWLWVDDNSGPCPDWAMPYEAAATGWHPRDSDGAGTATANGVVIDTAGNVAGPWGRSGDHLMLLYTGGTTGMPKGVMWRQEDLFGALDSANHKRLPPKVDLDAAGERIGGPGPRNMPAAPLMHGTGLFNAISNLIVGGSVITMAGRRFDPVELLDTIHTHKVNSMSIVGDAFAKPILKALDAEPARWDISSLRVIVSSGVMWSAETKAGLLVHNPRLIMVDSLGSSEAIGMATNTTTAESLAGGTSGSHGNTGTASNGSPGSATSAAAPGASTAKFALGPNTRVVDEEGRDVVPGSRQLGRVALRGYTPIGYYKDEAKSAATFQIIDGVRYSIPGDWAEVEADGTVKLLGRGSQCINTGGEKVYPEEVEEALKSHPSVADAAVVGVPDERFGQAICALVEPEPGVAIDDAALIAHVRAHLAAYKSPKAIVPVSTIGRAANGKLDYKRLTADAVAAVASDTAETGADIATHRPAG